MAQHDGNSGQFQTTSDTGLQIRGITDYLSLISPDDHPLFSRFGLSNPSAWRVNAWPAVKLEWAEDDFQPRADDLDGSITSTATTITLTDASMVQVGDVLEIGSEWVWVSAVNKTTEVATVTRAVAGTTAATHADAVAVTRITNAQLEGIENHASSFVTRSVPYNYNQEIHRGIKVSDRQIAVRQYGIENEYTYQLNKKMREAMIDLERALLYGKREQDTTSVAGKLGGLDYFINSSGGNTVSAGGAVTQDDFDEAMRLAYEDGGMPSVAIVSPKNMKVIKNIYDGGTPLQVPRTETTLGMTIERVLTPYGTVELLMNRWIDDSEIFLIDPSHFAIFPFQDFRSEELARTGTYMEGMLNGIFTCGVRHALKAHAAIISIS